MNQTYTQRRDKLLRHGSLVLAALAQTPYDVQTYAKLKARIDAIEQALIDLNVEYGLGSDDAV
jgi:hypothetical protein